MFSYKTFSKKYYFINEDIHTICLKLQSCYPKKNLQVNLLLSHKYDV